mmetsp:Transcript_2142/g.4792  ORF Transcript_2142/g.4792 Transcript_2142/m.4792 type:complete len:106 (+) Transcript_2142:998-1315(+)
MVEARRSGAVRAGRKEPMRVSKIRWVKSVEPAVEERMVELDGGMEELSVPRESCARDASTARGFEYNASPDPSTPNEPCAKLRINPRRENFRIDIKSLSSCSSCS